MGFDGEDVGAAGGHFHFGVRFALERIFDEEAGSAKVPFDFAAMEEVEVELHANAPFFFEAYIVETDVESEKNQPAGFQNTVEFAKKRGKVGPRNVNDGIESDDGRPGTIFDVEREHVAQAEFNSGIELASLLEHSLGKVEAEHIHATVVEVAGDVARAAAEVANRAGSLDAGGEMVEQLPIQRFARQFVVNATNVFFGEVIVAGLKFCELLRIHERCAGPLLPK